jgi:molybdate transport system substrate-binding protein
MRHNPLASGLLLMLLGLLLSALRLGAVQPVPPTAPAPPPLTVYAASSLTNALDELGAGYTRDTGQAVKFSYAASSMLARQLEAGAKADVFFSADIDWMDYVQSRGLIDGSSRVNVLGNELVLIAPSDSKLQLTIAPGFGLLAALGRGRLSTGDPDSVPVGKYARSALLTLGVWNEVADRLVRADNVRTALAFVSRGEAPLGIVYASDAVVDHGVRVVATFPANSHVPIVYPVALTKSATPGAAAFVAWLRSPAGLAVFRKYGFSALATSSQ